VALICGVAIRVNTLKMLILKYVDFGIVLIGFDKATSRKDFYDIKVLKFLMWLKSV